MSPTPACGRERLGVTRVDFARPRIGGGCRLGLFRRQPFLHERGRDDDGETEE